jgi:hypothetical protein
MPRAKATELGTIKKRYQHRHCDELDHFASPRRFFANPSFLF